MSLKRVQTTDRNLQAIQDNVDAALRPIQISPLTGGNLISSVSLKSTQANKVAHGLGRLPQAWILARQNTNTTVWETASDTNFLTLSCGANCTVSIWVS